MSFLRRCLELASRNVVLRRRLPRDFGSRSIYVSPDAALRFWIPGAEVMDPLLFKMVRALVRPGEKVWDLGANVGLFSFAAASLAGPSGFVLAIEPDPWLASLLNRSAARRRDDEAEVKILPAAISDHCGVSELHVAARGRASNFIATGRGETGGERYRVQVPTYTLDSLLEFYPPPTLIKIDIEGMEYLALTGAKQMLERDRPKIYAEVAEKNRMAVASALHGYRFYMTDMSAVAGIPNNLIAISAD